MTEIYEWAYKWQTLFNSGTSKQAQEGMFSHKATEEKQQNLIFNGNVVQSSSNQ